MKPRGNEGSTASLISLALTLVLVLSLALVFQKLRSAVEELDEVAAQRYLSYQLADELRQSSDDLTRLVRTYVVTGDPSFESQYQAVADIRNGKKPRPLAYWRIYWDFVAAGDSKPRPDGETISLLELMKKAGFTATELAKLAEGQQYSDQLIELETEAINMAKGLFKDSSGQYNHQGIPDPEQARRLVHDSRYHQLKARIMKPVDEFFVLLEERTAGTQQAAKDLLQNIQLLFLGLLIATLLSFALTVWLGYRQVIRILGGKPAVLDSLVQEIASGNLATTLPAAPAGSAIGRIADMVAGLRTLITGIRTAVGQVEASSHALESNVEQSAQIASETSDSTAAMAAAIEQMSVSITHISDTAREGRAVASESETLSADGGQIIERTAHEIRSIADVAARVSERINALESSSDQISGVVQVIREVADQTNLLALNAAIEAARAGETGRGFAVVADEVRKLAERTSAATGEIATMISSIQDNAHTTVNAMSEMVKSVGIGVEQSQLAADAVAGIRQASQRSLSAVAEIDNALGEQSAASQALAGQVERVAQNSEMANQASSQVSQSVHDLAELAVQLQAMAERFRV